MGSGVVRSGALDFSKITVQPQGLEALGLPMLVWRIGLRFVLAMVLVFASTFIAGAAELLRGTEPEWIDVAPLAEPDKGLVQDAADGVYVQLFDTQVRWEGETRLTYGRIAMRVLSRAGLEKAASLLRDFDPSYETLTLLRLDVRRGDRVIPHRDDLEATLIRREERLDYGIIDGTLTAHLEVPDVRVGDTVDVAVLWRTEPRIPGATFTGLNYHDYSVPMQDWRLILHWPDGKPMQVRATGEGLVHTTAAEAGGTVHVWRRSPVPALRVDDNIPPEVDPWGAVSYTAYEGWDDLVKGIAPHYLAPVSLSADWQARADLIAADHPGDPSARAYAALHAVQEEIRYVGVEIGPGGYYARDPEVVARQGFGDCKDKAVLLATLLKALDVPADVALTDLDAGHGLGQALPSLAAFDHMIVRAAPAGRVVWMDPTGSYEGGGYGLAGVPDYGFALPVTGPDAGKMQPIPPMPGAIDRVVSYQTIRFKGETVEMEVISDHTGAAADRLRRRWSTEPPTSLRRDYLDYYRSDFPGLTEAEPAFVTDDLTANRVRLTERYLIDAKALQNPDLLHDFPLVGEISRNDFPKGGIPRNAPYLMGSQRERILQLRVENAPIDFEAPEAVSISNAGFSLYYTAEASDGGDMTLRWHYRTLARSIMPDDVEQVAAEADRIADDTYFTWDMAPHGDRIEPRAAKDEMDATTDESGEISEDFPVNDELNLRPEDTPSGSDAVTSTRESDKALVKRSR